MDENTVAAFVRRLMPLGSVHGLSEIEARRWEILPTFPVDVFAVMATLVERSGAYRHVVEPSPDPNRAFEDQFGLIELGHPRWTKIARAWGAGLHPAMDKNTGKWNEYLEQIKSQYPEKSQGDRKIFAKSFGKNYLSLNDLIKVNLRPLQKLWQNVVVDCGNSKLIDKNDNANWWDSALKLMILSDMACTGVGFWPRVRDGVVSNATLIQQVVLDMAAKAAERAREAPSNDPHQGMLVTIASDLVDREFCSVLPKTRTAALGCTLRSLTHNLALLPPAGLVEARWRVPPDQGFQAEMTDGRNADGGQSAKPLNLLLIPFPYRFSSTCFESSSLHQGSDPGKSWGYFHLHQLWLDKFAEKNGVYKDSANDLLKFTRNIVFQAKKDMHEVHAIIFPEYALDWNSFDKIAGELLDEDPKLEFVVAGLSQVPDQSDRSKGLKSGNYVAVRGRARAEEGEASRARRTMSGKEWVSNHAREKHHRWKLDARQIERYGISKSLNPNHNWWESIPLGNRIIDFFVPRAGTAMTVLICEDLARADPVQTVVRSIGPNLVLALLMDGPQRKFRWPGHYAGVLADDPGCSVLTFTSMALVSRGMTSDGDQSRSIAFFKNSLGSERELFLPQGSHALGLRLTTRSKVEHSLDGRGDGGAAYIWELREVTPVRGDIDDSTRWIVEGST